MIKLAQTCAALALMGAGVLASAPASAEYRYGATDQREAGLILFDVEYFRGDDRYVTEDIRDLNYLRFNDRTQSIAVLGGVWEVCKHADFTGRCLVIREDVEELRDFGLGDEITAIRRISDYADVDHLTMVERNRYGEITYVYNEPDYYRRSGYASYGPYVSFTSSRYYGRSHYGVGPRGLSCHGFGYRTGYRGWHGVNYNYGWPRHNYGSHRGHPRHGYRNPPPPQHIGPKDAKIVLYADPYFKGRSYGANGAIEDFGQLGFNDTTSSIRINSGVWEVCSEGYFKGKCQIVDTSIAGTITLGLNDNISSIRPYTRRPDYNYRMGNPGREPDRGVERIRPGEKVDRTYGDYRRVPVAPTPPQPRTVTMTPHRPDTRDLAGGLPTKRVERPPNVNDIPRQPVTRQPPPPMQPRQSVSNRDRVQPKPQPPVRSRPTPPPRPPVQARPQPAPRSVDLPRRNSSHPSPLIRGDAKQEP